MTTIMTSVMRRSRRFGFDLTTFGLLPPSAVRVFAILLAIWVLPASQARAELPVREFQRLVQGIAEKDTSRMGALQYFLRGLLDGIAASNAAYVEAGAKPLVCVPHDPHPPFAEIVVAIQRELERGRGYWTNDPGRPVEPVALIALRRQWPCK